MDKVERRAGRRCALLVRVRLLILVWLVASSAAAQVPTAPGSGASSQTTYREQWAASVGDCDPSQELCCMRQVGCALLLGSQFFDTDEGTAFNRMRSFHALIKSLENEWRMEVCPREIQLAYHFYQPATEDGPRMVGKLLFMPADTMLELYESFDIVTHTLDASVWPDGVLCPELDEASLVASRDPHLREAIRLTRKAEASHDQGDPASAERWYGEALAMHREAGREPYVAAILTALGILAQNRNALEPAEALYVEALELERRLERPRRTALLLTNLATVEHLQGRLKDARGHRIEAADLYQADGDFAAQAAELIQLVQIADALRDHEAASGYARRASELYEQLEMPADQALAHLMAGASHAELSQRDEACRELTRARQLYERLQSDEIGKVAQVEAFVGCGLSAGALAVRQAFVGAEAAHAEGDHQRTVLLLGEAIEIAQGIVDTDEDVTAESLAALHGSHAYFLIFNRQFEAGEAAARRGLSLDPSQIWIQTNLAHALLFQDRHDEALTVYREHAGVSLSGERLWEGAIRDDFESMRQAGLSHDLMGQILESFEDRP